MKSNYSQNLFAWTTGLTLALSGVAHANLVTRTDEVIGACQAERFTSINVIRSRYSNDERASYSMVVETSSRLREAGGIFTNSIVPIFESDNAQSAMWTGSYSGTLDLRLSYVGTQPENRSDVAIRFDSLNQRDRTFAVSIEKLGNSTLVEENQDDPFAEAPAKEADTNFAYDRIAAQWKTNIVPFLKEKGEGKLQCQLFVDENQL